MTTTLKKMGALVFASAVSFSLLSGNAMANGAIGDHVNNLHAHIGEYTEEVHWLSLVVLLMLMKPKIKT